jgi:XRE family aerobic/anaerobic benzoate catabolism transcriptional regulator
MDAQYVLKELGRRLRAARERSGRSVSELAQRAGLSRRHVTEAEAGRANLSITTLLALANAAELPLRQLFDFEAPRWSRIALVGLRGAGKSTVGHRLALALEVPFVELDQRIEELAGLSLAAIFELHGTTGYRRLEAEALERVLAEGERVVLATGGSIVTAPETFARLKRSCHTVWLRAAAEDHYKRVARQGDERPMRGRPRALDELRALLGAREPLYATAELELDTSALPVDAIVALLVARYAAP